MNMPIARPPVEPARLRSLFSPTSIAVVGASESSSWARWLFNSLELPGRDAIKVIPVNPNRATVFGRPTIPSLEKLDAPVDLAFIMTPAATVAGMLEDVARAGVRNAVALASGFAEEGEAGRARQEQLAQAAHRLGITLLGPNTTGFANVRANAVPWAVAVSPPLLAGPVAGVFESGSITRAAFEFAQAHAIGTSLWVSVGNAAVVSTMDIIDYLLEDDTTRCIALFLESVRDPARFMAVAQRALAMGKPIVAMKTGRSAAGSRAGEAHTGALATNDAVVDAAMRQSGVVRAHSIEELLVTAGLFGYSPRLPKGRRMGVVTSSGGGCSVVADLAQDYGLELPAFSDATAQRMKELLPPYATLVNPLDVTGAGNSAPRKRPSKAEDDLLEIAAADGGFDFMFSLMNASFLATRPAQASPAPGGQSAAGDANNKPSPLPPIDRRLEILGGIVKDAPVPVFLASSTCLDVAPEQRNLLMGSGIHLLAGVDLAMLSLRHACWWVDAKNALAGTATQPQAAQSAAAGKTQSADAFPGGGTWPEDVGRALLERHGVPMVPASLVTSAQDARAAASRFGTSLAVKICSAEIPHKTDIGGVRLNVSPDDAPAAYQAVCDAAAARVPEARVRGVLVSPMRPPGTELLVGVTRDPAFGKILTVAMGGIWVEILKDASIRVLPVGRQDVKAMLQELKGSAVLFGARGGEAADADQLADVILSIVAAADSVGSALEALEVNPLRIRGRSAEGLDIMVSTTRPNEAQA